MNEKSYKCYIGIDVSKGSLDIALDEDTPVSQLKNNEIGFKALKKLLPTDKDCLVVMEATGGYERPCTKWLQQQGIAVSIVPLCQESCRL